MRKTTELLKMINAKKDEIRNFESNQQMDDAVKAANELQEMNREYGIAKAVENADLATFTSGVEIGKAGKVTNKTIRQLFNRAVFSEHPKLKTVFKPLNEEEMEILNAAGTPGQVVATPVKGGYLVPEEEMNRIIEYRRTLQELKQWCEIIPVTVPTGKAPTIGQETTQLTNFEELNDIPQSDVDFGQISFNTTDYGDIIPISNTLLSDTAFDLIGIIRGRFAKKSINTENAKIVAKLTALNDTAITDYKGIKKAFNVTLDPSISAMAALYTNQDGYEYLDELEDKNGNPILKPSLAEPNVYLFSGHPIRVISNALMPTVSKALPFIPGLMSDYVKFIDRMGIEISISTEAGFTKNATMVRAIERFDVQAADTAAMASLTLTLP